MPDRKVIHHTYSTANRPGGQYPNEAAARSAAQATLSQTPGALPQLQSGRTCADGSYDCDDEVMSLDVVIPASGGRRRRSRRMRGGLNADGCPTAGNLKANGVSKYTMANSSACTLKKRLAGVKSSGLGRGGRSRRGRSRRGSRKGRGKRTRRH